MSVRSPSSLPFSSPPLPRRSPVPRPQTWRPRGLGGGRKMYLDCHGTGRPPSCRSRSRATAGCWTDDLRHPQAPRLMVLPAGRRHDPRLRLRPPGDLRRLRGGRGGARRSRDPVPQPRTAPEVVADLHALLGAAGSPVPTSSPPTRWAASSPGSTPPPTPTRSSASSWSTPTPSGWRRS